MKKLLSIILFLVMLLSAFSVYAEENDLDITPYTEKANELGIPNITLIADLQERADALWEAGNYEEAIAVYDNLATQANWLANIIASVDKPFYSADSDDRDSFYLNDMYDTASRAEAAANSYKEIRNQALARNGMCYYYLKDYTNAVSYLMKALSLIEIADTQNWKMCADAVIDIVGLKPSFDQAAEEAARKAEEEAKRRAEEAAREAEEEAKKKAEEEAAKAAAEAEAAKMAQRAAIYAQQEELAYVIADLTEVIAMKEEYGQDTSSEREKMAALQEQMAMLQAQLDSGE